jgi:hypothetical protein
VINSLVQRINKISYYFYNQLLIAFIPLSNRILSFRNPVSRTSRFPAICFAFPESDPYVFDLFWRRLLTTLNRVAEIHILRLPHITMGQNISDQKCQELVSSFACMYSFLEKQFNDMSPSSFPGISIYSLFDLYSKEALFRLHHDISLCSSEELFNYQWKNLPLGSFLSTDLSLSRKRDSIESIADLHFCRLTLFFSVSACIAFEKLNDHYSFSRLAINNCYTFNLAFRSYASCLSLPVVNILSRSNDPGYVAIYTNSKSDIFLRRALASSPASFASPSTTVDFCFRYLRTKLIKRKSSQIYSPRGDKALRLSLVPFGSRYITYFTSSPDELRNSDSISSLEPLFLKTRRSLFADEFEVIRYLSRFCTQHQLNLVVRIHPRLGLEARSGYRFESPSLVSFIALEQELAPRANITFIHPDSPICSYSLGRYSLANVFWWSSIGIELAMLGAPCMPALADQDPGLGIRYHCFADRLPASLPDWEQCLDDLVSAPRFDHALMLQACSDFYFSIGYGFIDVHSIDPNELLAAFVRGTSIKEPQPFPWEPPTPPSLQKAINRLFDSLES